MLPKTKSQSWLLSAGVISLASLLLVRSALSDEPTADLRPANRKAGGPKQTTTPQRESIPRVSLEVARDRAKLLHEVYASTLDVMHRRYFHGDRAIVPARAMEDVFSDMKRQYHVEADWIAVTLKAMSIDHEPETAFEKKAAEEIKSGKIEVESIDAGYYRRAVAIPLTGGCISCHGGLFRQSTRKPFAGLVISIPVTGSDDLVEQVPAK
jgi:hypothetical protein